MGKANLDRVRSEALDLSEVERAELAQALIASLDGPADPDAAREWEKEILRRMAQIDSGTAKRIDRDELRRRMRARIEKS